MLVNTGVKAYKCKACKRKFSRKENLNRHVKLQKTGKQILQNVTFVKRKTAYLEFRFRLLFKNFYRKKNICLCTMWKMVYLSCLEEYLIY